MSRLGSAAVVAIALLVALMPLQAHGAVVLRDAARARLGKVWQAQTPEGTVRETIQKEGDLDKTAVEAEQKLRDSLKSGQVWKDMGVKFNKTDDWFSFVIALCTNAAVTMVCVMVFSTFRQRYRLVYQKNVWDNWSYSIPEQREEIVDGQKSFFALDQGDLPQFTSCGNPLPSRPQGRFFDWASASWSLKQKQIIGTVGLDQAMLIQFTNMAMMVFASIGLPMLLIVVPLHVTMGGNAAGDDYLSWQGFANVAKGSKLCWMHSFIVWYVVLLVDRQIYKFQAHFVTYRINWLQEMPHIQACSILVEGIPERFRTPERLKQYFHEMFGGREVVDETHLMVHTHELLKLIAARDKAKTKVMEKRAAMRSRQESCENASSGGRASLLLLFAGENLSELQRNLAVAEAQVRSERERLHGQIKKTEQQALEQQEVSSSSGSSHRAQSESSSSSSAAGDAHDPIEEGWDEEQDKKGQSGSGDAGGAMAQVASMKKYSSDLSASLSHGGLPGLSVFGGGLKRTTTFAKEVRVLYSNSAFITFKTRHDANMALRMSPYTPDREEFSVSVPPDPSDIVYSDFVTDRIHAKAFAFLGYALIVGLILVFLPTISFISSKSKTDALKEYIPIVGEWAEEFPKIASFWNGIAGALGLNIMLSFLPTMLVLISSSCFRLKAYAWAQHQLQKSYFLFLILFQLIVVAVSSSIENTIVDTVENPLSLVQKLSYGMCRTTHFFLSIFVIQWAAIAMEHTRYIQLLKYMLWKKITDTPEEAFNSAEPEDQDFYGMGARSARYTAQFVIGIVFISLCPLISLLAFIYFLLIRLFIGYQVVFAETKKPDLGGEFWVTTMKHCQFGLVIYIAVMTAVLYERGATKYPSLLAGLAMIYMVESILSFNDKFYWESLSHEEVMQCHYKNESGAVISSVREASRETYMQPELAD